MPMKQTGRKVYKTMQGKTVDMDLLRQRNELTQAVGNAQVNARGDELGPGGKIIRKKEEVLRDYYHNSSTMADEVAIKRTAVKEDVQEELAPTVQPKVAQSEVKKDEDWVEDTEGNFVRNEKKSKTRKSS